MPTLDALEMSAVLNRPTLGLSRSERKRNSPSGMLTRLLSAADAALRLLASVGLSDKQETTDLAKVVGQMKRQREVAAIAASRVKRDAGGHILPSHNRSKGREYSSWAAMKRRCLRPDHRMARWYSERGITICERWYDFANFFADMGPRPPGTSLDRIDVNGNYEPGNCRWAELRIQHNNKRNTRRIEAFGRTQSIAEWAKELGLSHERIRSRINRGISPEDALTLGNMRGRQGDRSGRNNRHS